jgi:hypothetical protein
LKVGLAGLALLSAATVYGAKTDSAEIYPTVSSQAAAPTLSIGTLSGGGNSGGSSSFRLASTVSQVAIGSGDYNGGQAFHGLWYVINGLAQIPCCGHYTGGFTGNANCDTEGRIDLVDVTTLIDYVYISHRELCCEANGNVNQSNGDMINLSDITRLIDFVYITHNPLPACQ